LKKSDLVSAVEAVDNQVFRLKKIMEDICLSKHPDLSLEDSIQLQELYLSLVGNTTRLKNIVKTAETKNQQAIVKFRKEIEANRRKDINQDDLGIKLDVLYELASNRPKPLIENKVGKKERTKKTKSDKDTPLKSSVNEEKKGPGLPEKTEKTSQYRFGFMK
jgi:hypothetical protein